MRSLLSKGFFVFAGLMAASSVQEMEAPPRLPTPQDPKLIKLRAFFREHDCPVETMAEAFLKAAEENHLDWRLLPALAYVESGGGRSLANNNLFGWDNGTHQFETPEAGIRHVASRLANAPMYRGRPIDALLYTYNPVTEYVDRVKAVMAELGPAEFQ